MFSKRNCSLKSISMIKILVFLLLSPAKRLSLVSTGDFLGDPVVKTPCFHCREHGFNPWSGNEDPTCHAAWLKKAKQLHSEKQRVDGYYQSLGVGKKWRC